MPMSLRRLDPIAGARSGTSTYDRSPPAGFEAGQRANRSPFFASSTAAARLPRTAPIRSTARTALRTAADPQARPNLVVIEPSESSARSADHGIAVVPWPAPASPARSSVARPDGVSWRRLLLVALTARRCGQSKLIYSCNAMRVARCEVMYEIIVSLRFPFARCGWPPLAGSARSGPSPHAVPETLILDPPRAGAHRTTRAARRPPPAEPRSPVARSRGGRGRRAPGGSRVTPRGSLYRAEVASRRVPTAGPGACPVTAARSIAAVIINNYCLLATRDYRRVYDSGSSYTVVPIRYLRGTYCRSIASAAFGVQRDGPYGAYAHLLTPPRTTLPQATV